MIKSEYSLNTRENALINLLGQSNTLLSCLVWIFLYRFQAFKLNYYNEILLRECEKFEIFVTFNIRNVCLLRNIRCITVKTSLFE